MSFERRNAAFCKAQTDMQMIYIEAEREVKQLKAENARLKQELEAVGTAAYLYGRTDIADENAKLRGLVRDMLRWMPCPKPCSRCERYEYPNGCEFERRRRELGVEVDA